MYQRANYRFPLTQEQEYEEMVWDRHVTDAYIPIKNTDGWNKCTKCGVFPRLWVFNNGNFAKCQCDTKDGIYSRSQVEVESICSHARNSYNGQSIEHYDSDALRKQWNLFAIDGVPRILNK